MKLPDFEALAILARIVDAGSFAGAARELGTSKATVSKAVRRLEERIGSPVFHRTTRRLSLTETGKRLHQHAERLLAEGAEAEDEAMSLSRSPRGLIRVTAPMSFGVSVVSPLICRFLAEYPDVRIELDLNDAQVDMIAGGFDAALRIAAMPDSSLVARRICPVTQYLLAAPSLLKRVGVPEHPMQLSDLPCLSYAYAARRYVWRFFDATGAELSVQPSGPLMVNNGDAMLPALTAGLGFGILPDFIARDAIRSHALEIVLPKWSLPHTSLHWVTPSGSFSPARVQLLGQYLIQNIKQAVLT